MNNSSVQTLVSGAFYISSLEQENKELKNRILYVEAELNAAKASFAAEKAALFNRIASLEAQIERSPDVDGVSVSTVSLKRTRPNESDNSDRDTGSDDEDEQEASDEDEAVTGRQASESSSTKTTTKKRSTAVEVEVEVEIGDTEQREDDDVEEKDVEEDDDDEEGDEEDAEDSSAKKRQQRGRPLKKTKRRGNGGSEPLTLRELRKQEKEKELRRQEKAKERAQFFKDQRAELRAQRVKKFKFTHEMDQRVREGFAQYGDLKYNKWTAIAEMVGCTPKQARDRWVYYLDPGVMAMKRQDAWSDEEDKKLIAFAEERDGKGRSGGLDWEGAPDTIGRTKIDCRMRLRFLQGRDKKTGPFTTEEDAMIKAMLHVWQLREGSNKSGMWRTVSDALGRGSYQVQTHWLKVMGKMNKMAKGVDVQQQQQQQQLHLQQQHQHMQHMQHQQQLHMQQHQQHMQNR